MSYNFDNELQGLSEREKQEVFKILGEFQKDGKSQTYENILYNDYDEIPVDIGTFMHDKKYLGNALYDQEGRFTVYPYWEEKLKDIFPDNLTTKYNTIIFTGAIGLGKSTIAVICLLYLLYRLLCLKDPYLYYGLQPVDKISISLMNITLANAKGVALDKMNQMILSSEWFMTHGKMKGDTNLSFQPNQNIEVIVASSNNQVIGRAIFANFTDEVNFGLTNDVEKLKRKQKKLISQIDARMKSRFLRGSSLPTLNIIASSKNSDQSFLDDYINTKKKNESANTLIVDEPQWVVDNRKNSKEKFYVAIGNKFLANELLPKDASELLLQEYRAKGYSLLQVPIAYYENFQDNIDGALTDIAGIATASSLKFISGMRWNEIKTNTYKNPFISDVIKVGNAKEDTAEYGNFFDMSVVDRKYLSKPLYIHLDMSLSGDKTGIAGVWIAGKKVGDDGKSSKELFYRVAFSVSIEAPKGYQISFEKNRNFIRWLKNQGFSIKGVSSDTFQSAQIQQQLKADGYNTSIISVDRLQSIDKGADRDTEDSNVSVSRKVCLPYQYFKSAIYERRLEVYEKCDLLTDEVLGLEKESDGRINHPENGSLGSKDQVDAVCGALWNASQNAEEFAFDYGETLETLVNVSSTTSQATEKEQMKVALEDEMRRLLDPIAKKKAELDKASEPQNSSSKDAKKPLSRDFGMGPSEIYKPQYLNQGIIVW